MAVGRPARVLHAREGTREGGAALDPRHHVAEGVEGVADRPPRVGERHRRRGGVPHLAEAGGEGGIEVLDEARHPGRLSGQDDAVGRHGLPAREPDPPAARRPFPLDGDRRKRRLRRSHRRVQRPRAPSAGVDDAPVLGRMLAMSGRLAREQGSAEGFRAIINTGRIGRQDVMHLHMHIIGGAQPLGRMLPASHG